MPRSGTKSWRWRSSTPSCSIATSETFAVTATECEHTCSCSGPCRGRLEKRIRYAGRQHDIAPESFVSWGIRLGLLRPTPEAESERLGDILERRSGPPPEYV